MLPDSIENMIGILHFPSSYSGDPVNKRKQESIVAEMDSQSNMPFWKCSLAPNLSACKHPKRSRWARSIKPLPFMELSSACNVKFISRYDNYFFWRHVLECDKTNAVSNAKLQFCCNVELNSSFLKLNLGIQVKSNFSCFMPMNKYDVSQTNTEFKVHNY